MRRGVKLRHKASRKYQARSRRTATDNRNLLRCAIEIRNNISTSIEVTAGLIVYKLKVGTER